MLNKVLAMAFCAMGLLLWQPVGAADSVTADTQENLIQGISQLIEAQARQQGRDVQVESLGFWSSPGRFVPGRFFIEWRMALEKQGEQRVDVSVTQAPSGEEGAGASIVGQARFLTRRLEWMWIARQPLPVAQGVTCGTQLIERAQRPRHDAEHMTPWTGGCDELEGLELRRPLMPGDVLLTADLRRPPLVRARSSVRAQAVAGAIAIQVEALALQDGAKGDSVWVKVPGRKAALKATVSSAGQVLLD